MFVSRLGWGHIGVWCLILVLVSPHDFACAADHPTRLRIAWRDLEAMVRGERVRIETTDGVSVEGRAAAVEGDTLVVDVGRSTRSDLYPKGRTPVDRSSIVQIRVTRYIGNGRKIGMGLGGAAGLTTGLLGASIIGLQEDANTLGRRKVTIALLVPGAIIGGLLAGWMLGRAADREVTLIEIIP